ncbi:MAG TPA: SCP2 sterol-binding domain-containing protein [Acidimicrobiales bacterium]
MRFLSPEWLDSLRAATADAAPGTDLRIRQRVTGGPAGDVEYVVALAGGQVRVEGAGPADVELTTDYDTAAAISQGLLSPAAAFAAGRLRVGGAVSSLVAHQDAFTSMGKLLAGVAEATTY